LSWLKHALQALFVSQVLQMLVVEDTRGGQLFGECRRTVRIVECFWIT
jgi:hypothetical protein